MALPISLSDVGLCLAQSTGPPEITITRYEEDWSGLSDRALRASTPLGTLKYIPLKDDPNNWLSTGLEVRARSERYDNLLWGEAAPPDDAYLLLRAMPYADVHLGQARLFVQGIAAYARGIDSGPSPIDRTGIDLLQAFGEYRLAASGMTSLTLRGGREMLSLGSERLVGTRYGPNVPLAFDGARLIVEGRATKVDIFLGRPVAPGPNNLDDRRSRTETLWSAYATQRFSAESGADIYYIGYRNQHALYGRHVAGELRHTLGARVFGTGGNWSWNAEAMVQFGHFGPDRIMAWGGGLDLERRFPAAALKPRLRLKMGAASGDGKAGDGKLGTFNALFPKGKYFGELSPLGPYNIMSVQPSAAFELTPTLELGIAAMAYWRESRGDGIYDLPGTLIRSGTGTQARFVGRQGEILLSWRINPRAELAASYSAFVPGGFIRDTGAAKTTRLIGLESSFKF